MAPTLSEKIERVKSCIVARDPWTSGTIDVEDHHLKLFYLDKEDRTKSTVISLTQDTPASELQHLADACDPATFGRGEEDVLDESYRKAGKLDKTAFSAFFDVNEAHILQRLKMKLFYGPGAEKWHFYAELYKLNVYGEGSFFKPHKDTPRGDKMWGSLVIVYPTAHEGGSLSFRHGDEKFIFDTSDLESNQLAYVAFFSDVEHEVLPVTEGTRVTLTYNLYYTKSPLSLAPSLDEDITTLSSTISALLSDKKFLPKGGILGFGLSFSYPVEHSKSTFDTTIPQLKGRDELLKLAFKTLDIPVSLRAIVTDKPQFHKDGLAHIMLSAPIDYSRYQIEEGDTLSYTLVSSRGAEYIHWMGKEPAKFFDGSGGTPSPPMSKEVAWIVPSTSYSKYKTSYTAFGNQAEVAFFYAKLCVMAFVGPAGDRKNADAYKGVPMKEGW